VLTHAGQRSKDNAERHAQAEYELFAERRRALLEAEGERANRQGLEDAARSLPRLRPTSPPPDEPTA
jgi:hypothetical protein